MKENDTIRKALEVMRTGKIMVPCSLFINGNHTMVPKVANDRECTELAIQALAALSNIDPDAKPQEPSDGSSELIESFIDSLDDVPSYSLHRRDYRDLITAHDDAIRREERKRAEDIVCAYWPDEEFIRAAILGKEADK